MSQIIKIRRGLKSKLNGRAPLATGEMGFCTDSKEVFIGDGASNILVGRASVGAISQRPAAGTKGRFFYVEVGAGRDSLYIDTGAAWLKVNLQIDDNAINGETLWSSEKIKNEIEFAKKNIEYQDSVVTRLSGKPITNPTVGARYIVVSGEDEWSGLENQIVEWNGTAWDSYTPETGWTCYVDRESKQVSWNGSQWVISGGANQSVEAGDGLQGGGQYDDIYLNVGAGNGISVERDAVSVKAGKGINVNGTGVEVNVDGQTLVISGDGKVKANYKFKPEEFQIDGEQNISLKLIDGGTF